MRALGQSWSIGLWTPTLRVPHADALSASKTGPRRRAPGDGDEVDAVAVTAAVRQVVPGHTHAGGRGRCQAAVLILLRMTTNGIY
jgi:hypothetical protein